VNRRCAGSISGIERMPSLNRQEASGSHGKKEWNPVTGSAPVGEE
jgi:hypothetical protein